jgi:hypothetical protein
MLKRAKHHRKSVAAGQLSINNRCDLTFRREGKKVALYRRGIGYLSGSFQAY